VFGLERIFDWIEKGWARIKPFFELDIYEKAGVMRFGHFHRKRGPGGLYWKIPLVRYEVEDVEPYITLIYDQHDVLADRTMGLVRRLVARSTYRELVDAEEPEKAIATALRRAVGRYGFKIHDVTFTGFTKARPIMWITQSTAASLDN
jgi:regulator of protease activity HflC (stomatin/prohibitin superfamily)